MPATDYIYVGYWSELWSRHAEHVFAAVTRIIVVLVAYLVIRLLALKLIRRLGQSLISRVSEEFAQARQARIRSLQSVLGSAVTFVLGFIAAIMILQAAGLNIVPLITTASVAGLAIGFGAQKLVKDWIAGVFILIEDQYGVGDNVTFGIAGLPSVMAGVVEDLGMRVTRVRDESGALYTVSNGDIIQVRNHSRSR